MSDLRTFTLWARELLTQEAGDCFSKSTGWTPRPAPDCQFPKDMFSKALRKRSRTVPGLRSC